MVIQELRQPKQLVVIVCKFDNLLYISYREDAKPEQYYSHCKLIYIICFFLSY